MKLYWQYCLNSAAWWIMRPVTCVTAERIYGPFTKIEKPLAADVHGVPL